MKRAILFLATMLASSPAAALSCLPPDALRLYSSARDSADIYAIVRVRIPSGTAIAVPEVPGDGSMAKSAQATTTLRLSGLVLNENGFGTPFDRDVNVVVTCLSIWCGSPVTDRDLLAALRLTQDGPELTIGPCGGDAMLWDSADIRALLTCHRTGRCGG